MLIFKCDWCGRTISDAQGMGVYTTQLKSLGLPSKSLEILSNGKHICEACMEKAGILMTGNHAADKDVDKTLAPMARTPEEPQESRSESIPARDKEPIGKQGGDETAVPASETENTAESNDNGSGKTDVDKILALRKAGWRVKQIAEEMHLEPQKISNILYQVRHNKPDKWKAFGLPM